MVAIFTGLGAGLSRGSASVLGAAGQLGSAALGRGGENVAVNAATGNLVITHQDEFLVGRGPDLSVGRAYNSLAEASDHDNGDQWQMGSTRWVFDVPAALNTAGSTVKRQGGDGSVVTYVYETRSGETAYWTTEGDGAHDRLVKSGDTWVWTDGSSRVTETYEDLNLDGTFRIREQADTDGNKLTFTYMSSSDDRIQRIATQNDGTANTPPLLPEQSYVEYVWDNVVTNRIKEIRTYYTDYGANPADSVSGDNVNRTLTRTRYGYDASGRLHTVTVDLSPEDNDVDGDGRKYVTTYDYDGTSNRVSLITQDDGSRLAIAYDDAGRVSTLTETVITPGASTVDRLTSFAYGASYTSVTGPDNQVTRLDYDGGDLVDAAVSTWVGVDVERDPGVSIGGEATTLLTSSAGASTSYVRRAGGAVAAGSTVRFTVSLQAVAGMATSQTLGLYGETSGWGTDVVSARIISGPGTLVTSSNGMWQVDGLSASAATRIEITRTYAQAETVRAYVYVDRPGGARDGQQLLVANAGVTVESANLAAPTPGTWTLSSATSTPSGGTAATLVTSPAGADGSNAWSSIGTVAAGTAVTFTVSLQAAGGWATEQSLGLWGGVSAWGSGGVTASIVSGPGTLVTSANGLWKVTGLSATQATRIQITRTYAQSEEARAYVYVDRPGGYRDGQQLIVSDASVTAGGANLVSAAVGTWSATRATRAPGGTVGGAEATLVTSTVNAQTAYVLSSAGTVEAGTTVRFTVSLQALAGSATTQALGLWGGTSLWGSGGVSARIVSGPGTLNASTSGLWEVSGLSTSTATRIEITRTYAQREEARAYVYVDQPGGSRVGQQLLVAGTEVTTDVAYLATRRLTRVTAPAVGGIAQTLQFAYDFDGNVTRVIDGAGKVTARTYDGMGNVLSVTDANGNMVTRTYGANNELVSETRTGSDAFGAASEHVTRYVYDTENHLRYVVSHEDRVTEYRYTTEGELDRVIAYPDPDHGYTDSEFTESALNSWRNGLGDRSSIEIAAYSWDSRGNAVYSIKYGIATASGVQSTAEGYSRTYYVYDQAGRVISRYEQGEAAERFVYDGFGRMVAAIDPTQGVTTYRFVDAATTTVVHMASGLTRTMVYNTAGELIAETSATPGYQPDALDDDIAAWGTNRVTRADAAAIGGAAAYTYTLDATGLAGVVSRNMTVAAGETVTWRITVKGNPTDLHRLALYGSTDTWGTLGTTDASAVIVSGPGSLVNTGTNGGRFDLTGLSASQETVIELRRTFASAQTVTAYFYVGGLTGAGATVPAGTAVTLAASTLTRTVSDSAFALSAGAGYLYDAAGRLRVATDATGYKSYFLYDAAGRKVAEVDHYGHVTEYRYDAAGRVAATVRHADTLSAGEIATLGNPSSVVNLASICAPATDDQWTWSVYDDAGRLIETIDGAGGVVVFSYDGSDRLVKTVSYVNKLSATTMAGLKTALPTALVLPTADAAHDAVSRSFYDGDGHLVGTLDGEGYLSEIVYDRAGRKTAEVAYAGLTATGLWAAGTFDALKTSALGASTQTRSVHYVYDGQGLLRFTVDNAGYVTSYGYNVAGKLITTIGHAAKITGTDYTYDDVETRVAAIASEPADRDSYSVYDGQGRLIYAIGAGDAVTAFTYDAAGRVIRTVQYATLRPTTALPTLAQMNTWAGSHAADTGNRVARNWYDAAGQLRFTVDAEGYVRRLDYDVAGRLVGEVAWANPVTVGDADTIAQVSTATAGAGSWIELQYHYDAAGRRDLVTDGEGYKTFSEWNANGTLASVYSAYGTADQVRTYYAYDGAGRVTDVYAAYGTADEAHEHYDYDGLGNRISVTDARGKTTTYTYDERGLVTGTTNAMSGTTAYLYNAFGEVVKATDARLNSTYSYYDDLGQVIAVRDAENYVTGTTYTPFGEVATVTRYYNVADGAASVGTLPDIDADGRDAVTRFTYDKLGRVVQKIDAEGYVETSGYSAFGQLLTFSRYELSVYGSFGGQAGTIQDAYAAAAQEQAEADVLAAAAAAADAAAATALAAKNAAQAAYDIAQSAATASAAEVTTRQATVNDLQSQVNARGETAVIASPLSYLQAYINQLQNQINALNAQMGTMAPQDQYGFYWNNILPVEQQRDAAIVVKSNVQNGQPLPSDYYYPVLQQAGYTPAQVSSYIVLGGSLSNSQAALATAQSINTSKQAALTAAQTPLTQANTAYTQAASAASVAHTAANTAQGEADAAETAALAAAAALRAALSTDLPGFTLGGLNGAASTAFQYDRRGNLTRTTDARGFYETYTYDAFGRRTTVVAKSATTTVGAGGTTTYTYDRRGLLLSETLPVQSYDATGAATGVIVNAYQYDGRGNLRFRTEAQGRAEQRVTEYTYDRLDRRVSTIGASVSGVTIDPVTMAVTTVSGAPTETVTYDAGGNVIRTVDAAGAVTVFFYDDLGRKTREIDALGTYTFYQYDANGNVTDIRIYETQLAAGARPAIGGADSAAPSATGNYRETSFAYDKLGRMTASTVVLAAGYLTGSSNGTTWTSASTTALATGYTYDAFGNVVTLVDPNLNATVNYYDKLGRKTAQVDAEGYLTEWAYDSDGNVLGERRHALRIAGAADPAALPIVAFDAADRVTSYTYDQNGNRLSEARAGVAVHNAGAPGTVTIASSTITYLYNGLGQVTRKTQATGDQVNYTYDAAGRLTQETRQSFVSNNGATVTPQVNYYYDGLGNLARSVQAAGGDATARVTTYTYGAGGRLASMTDAEGGVRSYSYDRAGHTVLEYYTRTVTAANGTTSTVTEGTGTRYDVLGRNLGQAYYTKSGSTWTFQSGSTYTSLEYNAFGDVVRTSNNGAWQQESKYDLAGRVWATSSGDGVWKYFGYDRNGNQTLAIASAGADLAGKSFATALGMIGQADVNGTYTLYDKRNLATSVVEEGRQLTGSGTSTLTTSRAYNAFGEVASETDAIGATITYTYNTMGRKIRSEGPTVSMTLADGTTRWIRPSQDYYYDAAGRLVASRDAGGTYAAGGTSSNGTSKAADSGNLTRLTLLAGTGYDGTEALVTHETHADGGVKQTKYDVHGNARVLIDEENRTLATNSYDQLGRLTRAVRLSGLTDSYAYDVLGQLVEHGNSLSSTLDGASQYLNGNTEITGYDIEGRVVSSRAFGGDVTTVAYTWTAGLAASGSGLSGTGGWTKVTTYANTMTLTEASDLFGRAVGKTDLGGHTTAYTYDLAGRLTRSQIGTTSYNYEYYNTGQVKKAYTVAPRWDYYTSTATQAVASSFSTQTKQNAVYTYDAVGNRLTEYGTLVNDSSGITVVWKDHTATYDALGRLIGDTMAATSVQGAGSVAFEYDANGNVRKKSSTYRTLNASGGVGTTVNATEAWYLYDAMNRVVLNNGYMNTAGYVTISTPVSVDFVGDPSQAITYNKAGQRTSVTTYKYYTFGPYSGNTPYGPLTNVSFTYFGPLREEYVYNAQGQLYQVKAAESSFNFDAYLAAYSYTNPLPPEAFVTTAATATLRTQFAYDAMGRQTDQKGYASNGSTVVYHTTTTFNAKGQVSGTFASTLKDDNKTYTQTVTNQFGTDGTTSYALGAVTSFDSVNTVTGGTTTTSHTSNTFVWWDGALQDTIEYDSDKYSSSNDVWETEFTYNGLGQLTKSVIADGKTRTVTFSLDEVGQIIRRDETGGSWQTGAPHEVWYRLGEREIGYVGNNGGDNPTMLGSLEDLQKASSSDGTFRGGGTTSRNNVGFAQALESFNSYGQGSLAGGYTVRAGDTLQAIAKRLYGDASLWYKIAEVNGLSANSSLVEGQQLTLPSGVTRNTYSDESFRPYDPAQAIGDLSPTSPKPAKAPKCGVFGQILLTAIAVAVTAVLSSVGVPPAIAATIGNAASQLVGVATGIQEKFSFKSLAITALSAGFAPPGTGNLVTDFVSNAIVNATVQGISVATGLQDKFDWAGVAAAGVSGAIGGQFKVDPNAKARVRIPTQAVGGTAATLAAAATRSAITGDSFGDSLKQALPSIVGQVMGAFMQKGPDPKAADGDAATAKDNVPHGIIEEVAHFAEGVLAAPGKAGVAVGNAVAGAIRDFGYSIARTQALDHSNSGELARVGSVPRSAIQEHQSNGRAAAIPVDAENGGFDNDQPIVVTAELDGEATRIQGVLSWRGANPDMLWNDAGVSILNNNSPYDRRSRRYLKMQLELNDIGIKNSFYFEAVSAMTSNLANMDNIIGGEYFADLSSDVRKFSESLSQGIASFNEQQFSDIKSGVIKERGAALDERLITDEQRYIQGRLDVLWRTDKNLYRDFIQGINRNANHMSLLPDALNSITDPAIHRAAGRARRVIGGDINFASEPHRVIMGRQMVAVLREQNQFYKNQNYLPVPWQ